MITKNNGMTLDKAVALLGNRNFCADSRTYWEAYRSHSLTIGRNQTQWELKAHEFMKDHLDPFTLKWGVYPASDELLISPLWQETNAAQLSGRWGIIPVYPWSTKKEVIDHLKRIQRAIGKEHIDGDAIRKAQTAMWLEDNHISTQTGGRPKRSALAKAVWGREKGLKRPTKREAIAWLSTAQERILLNRYLKQGKSYSEAEQLVYKSARGKESKASAAVRMALQRHRKRLQSHKVRSQDPRQSDKLAVTLTLLLREIPPSKTLPCNFDAICSLASQLSNLLLPPESAV